MLQKRAPTKVTFPNVWTNTACSHQLYGYEPTEVDDDNSVRNGIVNGAKAAAVRKLIQELGIDLSHLPLSSTFKFLTRLHYWAADVITHGPQSPWGEHEIDYILFAQLDTLVVPNPDEVCEYKYVSYEELKEMMTPGNGLLWSPWFRIIAEKFLPTWWKNLKVTLQTEKFVNTKSIFRFDPSEEHMGGAGGASKWLGSAYDPYQKSHVEKKIIEIEHKEPTGNALVKQGSYGKVITHKHSKITQLLHFSEVIAALQLKFGNELNDELQGVTDENIAFCNDMLGKVSRSFASVIRQLPKKLLLDILIFYLVLRALDTIEDDMEAFKGKENVKIEHLLTFHEVALCDSSWNMQNVGKGDERTLLEEFHKCTKVFQSLPMDSQKVISDITKRMGFGMAQYVSKDLGQGTVTVADYNLYCHYVAGLVGEGLSKLFACTGYESVDVSNVSSTLGNTMGLFLQKTNIIRDYLEDFVDSRAFWPQEIWKKYTVTGDLGDFADPAHIKNALFCLNDLVTDALTCVPECLEYLDLLKTQQVFRFCAIPQVMAIATLAELYNNPDVFTGVVKIRKGLAASLILDTGNVVGVHKWFNKFARAIKRRVVVGGGGDPSGLRTIAICDKIISLTNRNTEISRHQIVNRTSMYVVCALPFVVLIRHKNLNPILNSLALMLGYPLFSYLRRKLFK